MRLVVLPRRLRSLLLAFPLAFAAALVGCTAAPPPSPAAPAAAPVSPAEVAAARITPEAVFSDVAYLASDEMRGRDTPSPELERAAGFIADHFQEAGLEPAGDEGSYLQWWPFTRLAMDPGVTTAGFAAGGTEVRWSYGTDWFGVPGAPAPVSGTPVYAADPATAAAGLPAEAAGNPLVVFLPEGFGPDIILAVQAGMMAGASGIVLIMDEDTSEGDIHQIAAAMEGGAAGELPIPTIGIRIDLGDELLRSAGVEPRGGRDPPRVLEGVELDFRMGFEPTTTEVPNVVASLRGSDPVLRDTYVVVTAHFDHVGVGPADERGDSIYSGADDNASGTAALIQMARAFADLPEAPARSVLFVAVSGEEKGLLGSAWYAQNPTVPQGSMVANLNMDMVGRNHPDSLFIIGEEFSDLGDRARSVAAAHPELGLTLAPDPEPEEQAFLRSDHFSFVQQGIPALFFTTWLHDDYHQPSDTADLIDAEKLARVARLGFLLVHDLAQDPAAPEWNQAGRELLRSLSP
jgi:hypothetical protein